MAMKHVVKEHFGSLRTGLVLHARRVVRGGASDRGSLARFGNAPKCVLCGVANYGNLGDLAIAQAEENLANRLSATRVLEVETGALWDHARSLHASEHDGDLVLLHGGGNMGDSYSYSAFEYERCATIELFRRSRVIVMPQTIAYKRPDSHLLRYTQKVYGAHPDLHLLARERTSFRLMQEYYPDVDVRLVPDIVMSWNVPADVWNSSADRRGGVLSLRRDEERALSLEDHVALEAALASMVPSVRLADTAVSTGYVEKEERAGLVAGFLRKLGQSEILVTDRLHGMIFGALTGTPTVVLSNNNHKVRGVYEWLRDLEYVRYVTSLPEAVRTIEELLSVGSGRYPLKEILREFAPLDDLLSGWPIGVGE